MSEVTVPEEVISLHQRLGQVATDRISGFKGTVVAYTIHITGCNQVCLTPKVDKDGKALGSNWYDEQRLDWEKDVPAVKLDNSKTPGFGPVSGDDGDARSI
jgi:hypothetical protein